MIDPKAIARFLDGPRDSYDWLKQLPRQELLDALASLRPVPDVADLKHHQLVGLLVGIACPTFCFWFGMGSGKSLVALRLIDYWYRAGQLDKALVLVPSQEAIYSWQDEIARWRMTLPVLALPDDNSTNKAQLWLEFERGIILVSYPSLRAMVSRIERGRAGEKGHRTARRPAIDALCAGVGAMVLDECFVPGTAIETRLGPRPIEQITAGDQVLTTFGYRPVRRAYRKRSNVITKLTLEDGRVIKCTPNHPFFTTVGWVCAGNLLGETVYGKTSLRELWKGLPTETQKEVSTILRKILLLEMAVCEPSHHVENSCGKEQAGLQDCRMEQGAALAERGPRENQADETRAWARIQQAWGKWAGGPTSGAPIADCIRPAMEMGAPHLIRPEAARLSNLLQSRFRVAGTETGDRGRWGQPFYAGQTDTGQKEGCETSGIRVVGVATEKQSRLSDVYSLEIEGCPHYYAEGVLVHNSTAVKDHGSLNHRVCLAIAKRVPIRYALAGRPFGRDPTDLWGQHRVIDLGESLGTTLGLFREALFDKDEIGFGGRRSIRRYKFRADMEDDLNRLAQHRSLRYATEECVELPPLTRIVQRFTLPDENLAYYRQTLEHLIKGAGDETVIRNDFIRLRQLSSGFLGVMADEEGASAKFVFPCNPKLDLLIELLRQVPPGRKAIVFHAFTKSGEMIADRLRKEGIDSVRLWAGTRDRQTALRRFLTDPACTVLNVNAQLGAYALNLQVANYVIYFESPVGAIDRDQSERRAWRQGQERSVFMYDLCMRNGVDEAILAFHRSGNDLFSAIMRDPKRVLAHG